MKNILLCTSDPLLIKNLYGILRDEGFAVETVEHPALAVQKVIDGRFDVLVVDAEPFGLSAEDAEEIIRTVKPDMPILNIANQGAHVSGVDTPLDLEAFKRTVHAMGV